MIVPSVSTEMVYYVVICLIFVTS